MLGKIKTGLLSISVLFALTLGSYQLGVRAGRSAQEALHRAEAAQVALATKEVLSRSLHALSARLKGLVDHEYVVTQIEEQIDAENYTDTCAIDADRLRAIGAIRNPD